MFLSLLPRCVDLEFGSEKNERPCREKSSVLIQTI
jgi:hypothetical protein